MCTCRFKDNAAYYGSFKKYRKIFKQYGFKKHLSIVVVDGAAIGHHIGNSGHSAICGCCFCTVPKAFKYVCGWLEKDPATVRLLGELRTRRLNRAIMAKFEKELKAHLKEKQDEYSAKDDDFDLNTWLAPGQIHRADHPALTWIVKWARENGHSYRSVQLYDLDERCFIFDGLHGTINVINILNKILQEIQTYNGCTCSATRCKDDGSCCSPPVAWPLVEIMAMVLPQLAVPGIGSPTNHALCIM